jgi:UrcA family protein
MTKTIISFAAAALAATVAVAPAHAQDLRVEVGYSDLDIQSATGAEALAGRIEAGVGAACARGSDIRDLKAVATCKGALISEAVAQLNTKGATQAAQLLSTKG